MLLCSLAVARDALRGRSTMSSLRTQHAHVPALQSWIVNVFRMLPNNQVSARVKALCAQSVYWACAYAHDLHHACVGQGQALQAHGTVCPSIAVPMHFTDPPCRIPLHSSSAGDLGGYMSGAGGRHAHQSTARQKVRQCCGQDYTCSPSLRKPLAKPTGPNALSCRHCR